MSNAKLSPSCTEGDTDEVHDNTKYLLVMFCQEPTTSRSTSRGNRPVGEIDPVLLPGGIMLYKVLVYCNIFFSQAASGFQLLCTLLQTFRKTNGQKISKWMAIQSLYQLGQHLYSPIQLINCKVH